MQDKINCTICQWIEQIKTNRYPSFVKELDTGYVILAEHQYFKGYALFLSKTHAAELHELDKNTRMKFLEEMSFLSQAVANAFKPVKLNYELLGNLTPHMHWHIIPRYKTDPHPEKSIWELNKEIVFNDNTKVSGPTLNDLKQQLSTAIEALV